MLLAKRVTTVRRELSIRISSHAPLERTAIRLRSILETSAFSAHPAISAQLQRPL